MIESQNARRRKSSEFQRTLNSPNSDGDTLEGETVD